MARSQAQIKADKKYEKSRPGIQFKVRTTDELGEAFKKKCVAEEKSYNSKLIELITEYVEEK